MIFLKKRCCCCSLRIGSFIYSIILVSLATVLFLDVCMYDTESDSVDFDHTRNSKMAHAATGFASGLVLAFGTGLPNNFLVLGWLTFSAVSIFLNILYGLYLTVRAGAEYIFIVLTAVPLIVGWYFVLCYYKQLAEEEERKRTLQSPQNQTFQTYTINVT